MTVGVQELFQLLMRHLFDQSYGMFVMHETTRLYWFRSTTMDFHMEVCVVFLCLCVIVLRLGTCANACDANARYVFCMYCAALFLPLLHCACRNMLLELKEEHRTSLQMMMIRLAVCMDAV